MSPGRTHPDRSSLIFQFGATQRKLLQQISLIYRLQTSFRLPVGALGESSVTPCRFDVGVNTVLPPPTPIPPPFSPVPLTQLWLCVCVHTSPLLPKYLTSFRETGKVNRQMLGSREKLTLQPFLCKRTHLFFNYDYICKEQITAAKCWCLKVKVQESQP